MKNAFRRLVVQSSRGMTMILVMMAVSVLAALGMGMLSVVDDRKANVTENIESDKAFYVADGGMQYMIMNQINGDSNYADNVSPTGAPFTGSGIALGDGAFWAEYISQSSGTATIRVTGRVGNSVRVVEQTVTRLGGGLTYVTMVAGNFLMNSSTGDIYGDAGVKGNININNPALNIHGNLVQDPTLTMPSLDFAVYRSLCTSTHNGNLTISSNMSAYLCVNGNLTIRQNVTYTGLLYVTGNVTMNGDNSIINGSLIVEGNLNGNHNRNLQFNPVSTESLHMPAIATRGNLNLNDADWLRSTGVMWATGNLDLTNSDNVIYRGSFITNGNFIMNSSLNANITFDSDLLVGVPGFTSNSNTQTGMSLSNWKTY